MQYIGIFDIGTTTDQGTLLQAAHIFDVQGSALYQAKQVAKDLALPFVGDRFDVDQILIQFSIMDMDTFLQNGNLVLNNDGSYWYGSMDQMDQI